MNNEQRIKELKKEIIEIRKSLLNTQKLYEDIECCLTIWRFLLQGIFNSPGYLRFKIIKWIFPEVCWLSDKLMLSKTNFYWRKYQWSNKTVIFKESQNDFEAIGKSLLELENSLNLRMKSEKDCVGIGIAIKGGSAENSARLEELFRSNDDFVVFEEL